VAAQLFNLDVLAETINDRVNNTTRFLILRHRSTSSASLSSISAPVTKEGKEKTLVTFTVDHANPGALAQCLAVFAKFGLNLTSINTRPSGVENWNYVFFVEMQGSKHGEGGGVEEALKELDGVCRGARWLGSWESGLQ
jgi:prephenate dehydratase